MASPRTVLQPIERADPPKATHSNTSTPPLDSTLPDSDNATRNTEESLRSPRPMRIYTRDQLLSLAQSPLVKPPPDMPELKAWFGFLLSRTENEHVINKKDEPSTPSTARERRFRRDADDGDAPSRPAFRSTLQPSQMGNFKHQSLRANDRDRDRDRDRDGDKERERDIRDKEGQERLRHLSDKYDRDRLALPLSSGRNKDRDTAPHLNTTNTRGQQSVPSTAASRRAETREATKKKVGEASEDWRRGAEPPRSTREDRAENGRKDGEDRERARSQARDSSRPKRESSTSRRERDRDELRERPPRGDRERDDHRREKDDSRRERDGDAEDDPKRWRDDGKRDERMAARRDRGRATQDHNLDADSRRWNPAEDRERYKRVPIRRVAGAAGEENKEKDDRREKEKEPAWMDTYIPSDSTPGILGGQAPNGELDGIQAWKKGLKEKETKEREANLSTSSKALAEHSSSSTLENVDKPAMDEIQLFKLLMKKEEDKKRLEENGTLASNEPAAFNKEGEAASLSQQRNRNPVEDSSNVTLPSAPLSKCEYNQPQAIKTSLPLIDLALTPTDAPNSFSLGAKEPLFSPSDKVVASELAQDRSIPRLFPNSVSPESYINQSKQAGEFATNNSLPPTGSRLLAFRLAPKAGGSTNPPHNLQALNGGLQNIAQEPAQGYQKNEPLRPLSAFSPFDDHTRQSYGFEEPRDSTISPNQVNSARAPVDHGFNPSINLQAEPNYNGMPIKGSRFAKFFDGKARDGLAAPSKSQVQGGYISPPPNHNQRQELSNFGGATGNPGDQRSVEDLFAMLNISSQRGNLGHHANPNVLLGNNGAFGTQGPSLHTLQQQHLLQQQQPHPITRLEPLYDSRADDRSFVPDGMVPGLRPIPPPPPRGRDNVGHFDPIDDSMHYNLQRLAQQQQSRNLDPMYSGPNPPIFAQQSVRHGGGLPLQSLPQPHYRGGPSPSLNLTGSIPNGPQQQRLPPGLANLGGRPPHEPAQFIGLPGLPSGGAQHSLHANGPPPQQQLTFNNFNVGNNIGFNGSQARQLGPTSHLQNTGAQQHPLGNIGHPSMDPRLSNHHHLMGLGGSGVGGNRLNGGFPQQGPVAPTHIVMRPQQQPQPPHLLPHMLPHLMPPHLQQQGHPAGNNQPNHDLMALLMGGPHRE